MQRALIGKKIGMTQIFDEAGNVVPVTVVEAGPCAVVTKKTVENDGYAAVQLGFGDLKPNKVKKPIAGHFAKNDVAPKKVLKEFRLTTQTLIQSAISLRLTPLKQETRLTLQVPARVKVQQVLLSAGISTDLKKHTVQVLTYVTAVQSVCVHPLREYSRARR